MMCSSKNNSNEKKLCNWINGSNATPNVNEKYVKNFKIIKTHIHTSFALLFSMSLYLCLTFSYIHKPFVNVELVEQVRFLSGSRLENQMERKNLLLSNQNYARNSTISGCCKYLWRSWISAHSTKTFFQWNNSFDFRFCVKLILFLSAAIMLFSSSSKHAPRISNKNNWESSYYIFSLSLHLAFPFLTLFVHFLVVKLVLLMLAPRILRRFQLHEFQL